MLKLNCPLVELNGKSDVVEFDVTKNMSLSWKKALVKMNPRKQTGAV
jgi:hypothetical protein